MNQKSNCQQGCWLFWAHVHNWRALAEELGVQDMEDIAKQCHGKECFCIPYSGKIWWALYLANWLFRSIGDFNLVIHDRTRCFDGCGLGPSEHLLESTADKRKREVLKSKKSMDVFEDIIFTSKFGHHSLEKNWRVLVRLKTPMICLLLAVVRRSLLLFYR